MTELSKVTYACQVWPVRGGLEPALAVDVEASLRVAQVGQAVTYTYRVTNTGKTTLDPVIANDDRLGTVPLGAMTLAPGQGASGVLTYTVSEADLPGPLTHTVTASGTPPLGSPVTATAVLTISLVRDSDGVDDSIEDGAPNGGDGNGDGVPDKQQSHVTSLPNATTGGYVTLVAPQGTSLTQVEATSNPSTGDVPDEVSFPQGFFAFGVDGLAAGDSITVTLILHDGLVPDGYWKYGPTPGQPTAHWYSFLLNGSTGATGATMDGSTVVLRFTDGGRGDSDLSIDGQVADPGGPTVLNRHYIYLPLTVKPDAP
jgi:hypothetical protein